MRLRYKRSGNVDDAPSNAIHLLLRRKQADAHVPDRGDTKRRGGEHRDRVALKQAFRKSLVARSRAADVNHAEEAAFRGATDEAGALDRRAAEARPPTRRRVAKRGDARAAADCAPLDPCGQEVLIGVDRSITITDK